MVLVSQWVASAMYVIIQVAARASLFALWSLLAFRINRVSLVYWLGQRDLVDKVLTMLRPMAAIGQRSRRYVPLMVLLVAVDIFLGILNPLLSHIYSPRSVLVDTGEHIYSTTYVYATKRAPSYQDLGAIGNEPINGLAMLMNYTCKSLLQNCTLTKELAGVHMSQPEALEEIPANPSQFTDRLILDNQIYPVFSRRWGRIQVEPLIAEAGFLIDQFGGYQKIDLLQRTSSDRRQMERVAVYTRDPTFSLEDFRDLSKSISIGRGIMYVPDGSAGGYLPTNYSTIAETPIKYMWSPVYDPTASWNHSSMSAVLYQADDDPQNFTIMIELEVKQSRIFTKDTYQDSQFASIHKHIPSGMDESIISGIFRERCNNISHVPRENNNTVAYMRLFSEADSFGVSVVQLAQYSTKQATGFSFTTLKTTGRIRAFRRPKSCIPQNVDMGLSEPYYNFIAKEDGSDPNRCARYQTLAFDAVTKSRTLIDQSPSILAVSHRLALPALASLFGSTPDIPGLMASFATNTLLEGAIQVHGSHVTLATGVLLEAGFWVAFGVIVAVSIGVLILSSYIMPLYFRSSLYNVLRMTVTGDPSPRAEIGLHMDEDKKKTTLTVNGAELESAEAPMDSVYKRKSAS
ncbi:hypothetical protein EC973_008214 [Apophysomyces ossiformis]|uniref:Uncharacterized protein n=1 Tax=Apophysomyces ossiformis TaxID=679940 RepID=A0A8H7BST1_9FUNG|nr:hypothetical protein EC973_008214 [Apophysomyces ossiformis]